MLKKRLMRESDERFDKALEELKSINIQPPKKKRNGRKVQVPSNGALHH